MKVLRRLRTAPREILEWSVADKGLLLIAFLIPLCVEYVLWATYVLLREDRTALVDVVYIKGQRWVMASFIAGALALLAAGLVLRRRKPNSVAFQFVCATYYGATLVWCGYLIGTLSFTSGIVLLGAPLVGLILLERWIVYLSWVLAMLLVVALSYAGAEGLIAYAPMVVPPTPGDPANQLFWTTSTLFFAAPHMIFIITLAHFMLRRWRERENAFRELSVTDALTGVHNRRSILGQIEREVSRRHRRGAPVAVVLLDLDHFKRINDTWGHPTGDAVLKSTATVLSSSLRQSDALGRFGGEEFLLLLPDTDLEGARIIAERCRERLAQTTVRAENGECVTMSASFGIAGNACNPDIGVEALVSAADGALYQAKQAGRNRVEVAGP